MLKEVRYGRSMCIRIVFGPLTVSKTSNILCKTKKTKNTNIFYSFFFIVQKKKNQIKGKPFEIDYEIVDKGRTEL